MSVMVCASWHITNNFIQNLHQVIIDLALRRDTNTRHIKVSSLQLGKVDTTLLHEDDNLIQ